MEIPEIDLDSGGPLTVEAYATFPKDFKSGEVDERTSYGPLGLRKQFNRLHFSCQSVDVQNGKSSVPNTANRKFHVAGVWTGKDIRLFVNGVLEGTKEVKGGSKAKITTACLLGKNFSGVLDEVRISKVARYDSDFKPAQRFEPDADTLALYHFDDGQGDLLRDSSGNKRHGKIIGARWVKADGTSIIPGAVELLPLIDLQKDRVAGAWTITDTVDGKRALRSDAAVTARVQVPYRPPAEYDLQVEFTRNNGNGSVNVFVVGGGRQGILVLNGWQNAIAAIDMVDGKRGPDKDHPATTQRVIETGRRYPLLVQVRKDGLKVFLDGGEKPLLDWKTNFQTMAVFQNWLLRDGSVLGLGSHEGSVTFHRLAVVEVSGPGSFTRPDDPAAKKAAELRNKAAAAPPDKPDGAPLSPLALVSQPPAIPGVQNWSIEPRGHRGPFAAAPLEAEQVVRCCAPLSR